MSRSGLSEFEAVLVLAKRGSFRAAATELGLSTSAFSSAVASLEARLGVRLFHRTTRSVSLTEAGRDFVAEIEPALARIRSAVDTVGERRGTPTGTIRINSSLGAARVLLQPLVLEFLRHHPSMNIDIVTEGRLVDIVDRGFDIGIRPSALVPGDMVRVPIASRMRFVVVGSADYFSRRALPRTLEDLSAHACIRARHPDGTSTPWEFRVDGASRTLDVPGNLTLDTPVLMVDAVERGWGLAQVAEWYVERSIAEGHLVQVLDAWAPPVPELSLYYADRRHMPAGLRAFIDLAHRMNLALRSRR